MEDGSKIRWKDLGASDLESSSSSSMPSKRTRGPSNGIQVPSCLVDGCNSDLSKCRDYHRRHKVCELHSKTPKVTIGGREQRFCQQCSRFHSLVEFDDEKRSCRKRLDGHNRRRRKPQPEPVTISSGRFLSSYQGTRFSPFQSRQAYPSAAMNSALAMAGPAKSESDEVLDKNHLQLSGTRNNSFPGSLNHSYTTGKEFSFLQSSSCALPETSSVSQSLIDSNSALNNCGNSQRLFSSNWLYQDSVDSKCALSLLSSTPTDTKEIGLSHMMQPNSSANRQTQSLIPASLHYSGLGMVSEPVVKTALVTDGSVNGSFHCQDMFRIWPEGSTSGGPHHNSPRGSRIPP